jgi:hypothetical protein
MNDEQLYAACPKCVSLTERHTEEDARDTIEKHADRRHNGEQVGMVIDAHNLPLHEFVREVKKEANEQQVKQLKRQLRKGKKGPLPKSLTAKDFDEVWRGNFDD